MAGEVNEARIAEIVRGALHPVVRQLTHLAGEYAALTNDASLTAYQRQARQATIVESLEALGILHCDVATRQLMTLFNNTQTQQKEEKR